MSEEIDEGVGSTINKGLDKIDSKINDRMIEYKKKWARKRYMERSSRQGEVKHAPADATFKSKTGSAVNEEAEQLDELKMPKDSEYIRDYRRVMRPSPDSKLKKYDAEKARENNTREKSIRNGIVGGAVAGAVGAGAAIHPVAAIPGAFAGHIAGGAVGYASSALVSTGRRLARDAKKREFARQQKIKAKAAKKSVNEQQLDEISNTTLKSYVSKAAKDLTKTANRGARYHQDLENHIDNTKPSDKNLKKAARIQDTIDSTENREDRRISGIHRAGRFLGKDANWARKKMNEVSADTLTSYAAKSVADIKKNADKARAGYNDRDYNATDKAETTINKRKAGVRMAINKISKLDEDYEQAASAKAVSKGRGRPRKNPSPETVKAEEGDVEHIITQLRKVSSLRGRKPVTFKDGKAFHLPEKHAKRALDMYSALRTTDQKDNFSKKLHHSVDSFKNALNDRDPGSDPSPRKKPGLAGPSWSHN